MFLKGTQIKIKITQFKADHSVPTNQKYLSLLAFLLLFVKNFKHIQKWREEHSDPPVPIILALTITFCCFCYIDLILAFVGFFVCLFILKHDLGIISFYL